MILGKRQFGDGELVLDRAGLLLVDLGVEQIANNALRFVLAFDSGRHDLVEGGLHAVELQLAHEVEQLSTFEAGQNPTWNLAGNGPMPGAYSTDGDDCPMQLRRRVSTH